MIGDVNMWQDCVGWDRTRLSYGETVGLREFFQRERDTELGRWRWPENPDWVVYHQYDAGHGAMGYQLALNERTGMSAAVYETFVRQTPEHFSAPAALAYYNAQGPKPWHDAKPGEAWALIVDGKGDAAVVNTERRFVGSNFNAQTTSPLITAGRRIWPEES